MRDNKIREFIRFVLAMATGIAFIWFIMFPLIDSSIEQQNHIYAIFSIVLLSAAICTGVAYGVVKFWIWLIR